MVMDIYDFDDYRKYTVARLKTMPNKGRGQSLKLSRHIGVHTSLISQVLKGYKDWSLDQAFGVCDFLGLNDSETKIYMNLVESERASRKSYREFLIRERNTIRKKSQDVRSRITEASELNDEQKGVFYSHWYFSAIRILTSLKGIKSAEKIADCLGLDIATVRYALDFLVRVKLCKYENSEFKMGPNRTHVSHDSPFVSRHHTNWRLKGIEMMNEPSELRLNFTSPMSLSRKDALEIRWMLLAFIQSVSSKIDPSPPEVPYCLNIDWFPYSKF
jgi:uncharacterized protein (TIGR02147 family)